MTETQTNMGEEFTIRQSVSVCQFVPLYSHQAISNLSADLGSLGQGGGFETICTVLGPEMGEYIVYGHARNTNRQQTS